MGNTLAQLEEIGRILVTLATGLDELQTLLAAGKRDAYIDDTIKHCCEMADILIAAVKRLDGSVESDAARAKSATILARVVLLERQVAGSRLH